MTRKPGVWFPAPRTRNDIEFAGPGVELSTTQVVSLLLDPDGEEQRDKVGVTGGGDGSAKLTTRLLKVQGWFFKTDQSHASPDSETVREEVLRNAKLAAQLPIWHPKKCYFLLRSDPLAWPVSYCPALTTLRQIVDWDTRWTAWRDMISYAISISEQFGIGLDVNPSNFGFEPGEDRLFYIDDETYPPLTLRDIAEAMAARIPENPDRLVEDWMDWGIQLQPVLAPHCKDVDDWLLLIAGLRDYPMTNRYHAHREALVTGVIRGHPKLDRSARKSSAPVDSQTESLQALSGQENRSLPPRSIRQPPDIVPPPPVSLGVTCVFADVHGNLAALQAVLAAAREAGASNYLFLGDVVGYGPHPNECVQLIHSLDGLVAIRGNHDHVAADSSASIEDMNRVAREALMWTRNRLGAAERHWLASLPLESKGPKWLAVHGAPCCPDRFHAYVYELTYRDNFARMEREELSACFYGHTHVPFVYRRTLTADEKRSADRVRLFRPGEIVMLNPGSVGQPRDGNPRAAFALWDRRTDWVTFHRISYSVGKTTAAITAVGLPEDLVFRLEIGR